MMSLGGYTTSSALSSTELTACTVKYAVTVGLAPVCAWYRALGHNQLDITDPRFKDVQAHISTQYPNAVPVKDN